MKRIEAIVRPSKMPEILDALRNAGSPGVMVTEIEGYGIQRGIEQEFRGKMYKTELLTKTRLEIIVKDDEVVKIAAVIRKAAYTGKEGDGKIFITTVDDAIRIRTGEEGDLAI